MTTTGSTSARVERVRALFRRPDFARLMTAQYIAQASDGIAQAAFALVLVLDPLNQRTPGKVLALFAVTLLPYSLLSPFSGVLVDRYDRRSLMAWANGVRGLLLITLPAWSHAFPGDGGLFAAVLILLGAGRLFLTTKGAVLPVVCGERHLLSGNSISGGGGMMSALAGGIIGVSIAGAANATAAFVVAGIAYVGAAVAARSLSAQTVGTPKLRDHRMIKEIARVGGELLEGFKEVARRPRASLPLGAIFLLRTLGTFVAIAAILVIKQKYPEAGDRFGRISSSAVALGAAGMGSLVGALIAPGLGRRLSRPGLILAGFVISGVAVVALGGIIGLVTILALMFVGGIGGFLTKVAVDASVQDALPNRLRGRAFALYDILYNLASVFSGAFMVLADGLSIRTRLMIAGMVILLSTVPLGSAMRRSGMFARAQAAPNP